MEPFTRARNILADAQMSGALGHPYDAFAPTARWYVSADVFDALKAQMERDVLGPHERIADNVSLRLLGWPLDVIGDAQPDTMELRISR